MRKKIVRTVPSISTIPLNEAWWAPSLGRAQAVATTEVNYYTAVGYAAKSQRSLLCSKLWHIFFLRVTCFRKCFFFNTICWYSCKDLNFILISSRRLRLPKLSSFSCFDKVSLQQQAYWESNPWPQNQVLVKNEIMVHPASSSFYF